MCTIFSPYILCRKNKHKSNTPYILCKQKASKKDKSPCFGDAKRLNASGEQCFFALILTASPCERVRLLQGVEGFGYGSGMESEEYIEDDDNNSGDEMNVEFGVHRDVTMVPEAINLNVQAAEEFIRENRWLEEMMEEERVTKEQVEEET